MPSGSAILAVRLIHNGIATDAPESFGVIGIVSEQSVFRPVHDPPDWQIMVIVYCGREITRPQNVCVHFIPFQVLPRPDGRGDCFLTLSELDVQGLECSDRTAKRSHEIN
jgi:hypothetical protein